MSNVNVSLAALSDVNSALKKFQTDTEYLPGTVSSHIQELLFSCEREIENAVKEIDCLIKERTEIQDIIEDLNYEFFSLDADLHINKIRLDEVQFILQDCIAHPEKSPGNLGIKERELKDKLRRDEDRLNECLWELDEARDRLGKIKNKIEQKQNKLNRMRAAYPAVQTEFIKLAEDVKKFCRYTTEQNSSNISSVNLCIKYLEEYMFTNL